MVLRLTLLIVLSALGSVRADEVFLHNGARLFGQVLERRDGRVTVRLTYGTVVLKSTEIARIDLGPTPWQVAAEKASALRTDDVDGHLSLARECQQLGLASERDAALLAIYKVDPDHAAAHALAGEIQVHGIWLPEAIGHQVQGHVWKDGAWVDGRAAAAEAAARAGTRAERRRVLDLEAKVRRLVAQIGSSRRSTRIDARDALLRLAKDAELPHLAPQVAQLFDRYETFYRAHGHALVEARLSQATLVGLRRRTVGLGNGGAVTLELPEVRTVSIGTTVAVPLGR